MINKAVICNKCAWVSFSVSLPYVKKWESDWITYWSTLDDEGKDMFGVLAGPPKMDKEYLKCCHCGGDYKNFRDAKDEEVPFGSTMSGILDRNEDVN